MDDDGEGGCHGLTEATQIGNLQDSKTEAPMERPMMVRVFKFQLVS
jgi:hypothetical protein